MMQTIYKFVYGNIYKVTKHIGETARSRCIFVCCLVLSYAFFSDRTGWANYIVRDMGFGSVMFMIMSLLSIDRDPDSIRWNRWTHLSMAAFGMGMLLIGQLHYVGVGYLIYALDLIFVFPAFYYVQISTESSERIYRALSLSMVIAGIASYLYTWILAAQGRLPDLYQGRFFGHFDNPNSLGMVGAAVLIAGLYLIVESNNKWVQAVSAAAIGIGVDYALLSVSRSTIICEAICIIAFLIFLVKRCRAGIPAALEIKKIIVYIAIAAAVMAAGTKFQDLNLSKRQSEASVTLPSVVLTVEAASGESSLADRPGLSDGLDVFSSGRIGIWKIYIKHFSWLGVDVRDLNSEFVEGAPYRAHNNFIDYTVRCGYIVGFFYLLFYVAVGIKGLIILFSKKRIRPEDFLLVSVIGAYSIQALVEVATLPFTRIIPCMFFLTIAPLMGRNADTKSVDALGK